MILQNWEMEIWSCCKSEARACTSICESLELLQLEKAESGVTTSSPLLLQLLSSGVWGARGCTCSAKGGGVLGTGIRRSASSGGGVLFSARKGVPSGVAGLGGVLGVLSTC